MNGLEIVLRLLHIAAAITLGGALVYQLLALQPALRRLDEPARAALRQELLARWTPMVWTGIAVLLVTGLVNYVVFKIPTYRAAPYKGVYHGLLGVKILAGLAVFHAGAMLVLPAARRERAAARAPFWAAYGAVMLGVVIVLGAVLRYLPGLYP